MIRFLIRAAIFLGTAAIGILVAAAILPDFQVSPSGALLAIAIFAIAQSLLAPFILKQARRSAPALLGGIGLVSTFVALLITSFFPGGISVTGNIIVTWILATLIVWIITALGAWLLPLIFLKDRAEKRRAADA
ncbi:MAG: hypothetical protein BGO95_11580 [Micrococcales bacterium 73-13]|nr:MAG: hypothetical protein BGO95_11580 [Micrococcales bacterium 73-13]